jgi:arylsulfatase A-like enzyme
LTRFEGYEGGRVERTFQKGRTLLTVSISVLGVLAIAVVANQAFRSSKIARMSDTSPPERVIFVTIDTLRADHLPAFGYPRNTAPFIERLLRRGVLFTEAYSASSHTAPSHASLFTSLYPPQHNVLRNHETLSGSVFSLARMAEMLGFEVAAFPAVRFLYDPARDVPGGALTRGQWFRPARVQGDRVVHYLKHARRSERFFLWLHFFDVHEWQGADRTELPPVEGMAGPELAAFVKDAHKVPADHFPSDDKLLAAIEGYDRRLRSVDEEIKRVAGELDLLGLGQDTLWVIVSDHGEGLGNHHYDGHGEELYREQLHVPLIIARQDGTAADEPRKTPVFTRTVDVLPTLAELFQFPLDEHARRTQGRSLLKALTDTSWQPEVASSAFAQRRPKDMRSHRRSWLDGEVFSFFTPARKLIERTQGSKELYFTDEDPRELKDRFSTEDAVASEMRQQLTDLLGSLGGEAAEAGVMDTSPSALEELKALGYL